MTKTDWFQLFLNACVAFVTFIGAVDSPGKEGLIVFMLATLAVVINSLVLVRRTRTRDAEPQRVAQTVDELDARTILDLDARLEALERAQHDAVDAARWRALVESGTVTGPAADLSEPAASTRSRERV